MFETLSRNIYEALRTRILLYTVIVSIPSVYFPFLNYFGSSFQLMNDKRELSGLGSGVTVAVLVGTALLALLRAAGDKYNSEVERNGTKILDKLVNAVKESRESKFGYYRSFISDHKKKSICDHMAPEQEIRRQISVFRNLIAELIDADVALVGISVYYRHSGEQFSRINTDNIDSAVSELLNSPKSTLAYMIAHKESPLFFPDKRIAIEQNKYFPGTKDPFYKNIGSIFCERILVEEDGVIFTEAYLSISTYGTQICDVADSFAFDKFANVIVKVLKDQVKVELAKLYIDQRKQCPKKEFR